jgi:hypothetical protein
MKFKFYLAKVALVNTSKTLERMINAVLYAPVFIQVLVAENVLL